MVHILKQGSETNEKRYDNYNGRCQKENLHGWKIAVFFNMRISKKWNDISDKVKPQKSVNAFEGSLRQMGIKPMAKCDDDLKQEGNKGIPTALYH